VAVKPPSEPAPDGSAATREALTADVLLIICARATSLRSVPSAHCADDLNAKGKRFFRALVASQSCRIRIGSKRLALRHSQTAGLWTSSFERIGLVRTEA
jgi:hypothetical protein